MDALHQTAHEAATAAATILTDAFAADAGVTAQVGRDIKTRADVEAEQAVLELLAPSGLPVLSEEAGADADLDLNATCWIVDPLDGTMNFVRGIPMACVSIALWSKGMPVYGVIHDIASGERWSGGPDVPTTCNDQQVHVGDVVEPGQAVLTTGFPRARDYGAASLAASLERMSVYKKVPMIGAAAGALAWTAGGRMDLYVEEDIFLWDIAAGLALVEGAGGSVRHTAIDAEFKCTAIAGVPGLVAREADMMGGF